MRHSYLDYMRRVLEGEGGRQIDCLGKVMRKSRDVMIGRMEITNEANLTGCENVGGTMNLDAGENVGGATAAPAAPEVAGGDDDGDGDGESDSDRRPQRRSTRSSSSTRSTLPPAQLSRPKAACALLGIGRTKLHHLSERDPRFPRKIVLGPRCVGWRTDALLDYLRLCEQEG